MPERSSKPKTPEELAHERVAQAERMERAKFRKEERALKIAKLRMEVENLRAGLKEQSTRDLLAQLEIESKRKPWWKREPIPALTLAFTILTTILSGRPNVPASVPTRQQAPISETQGRTERAPSAGSDPRPETSTRGTYRNLVNETEDRRFNQMLLAAPKELRDEIDLLLKESRHIYGEGADDSVIRQFVQSRLEMLHKTDPLWKFRRSLLTEL